MGNVSDLNKVYLGFHEGLQYSVLGPAHIPDDFDFQATSYGSHTECCLVTTQCGAKSVYGESDDDVKGPNVYNFVCNDTMVGLNMTGNFGNLGQTTESYANQASNVSDWYGGIEDNNTMNPSNFAFGFQYFNNSAKLTQVPFVFPLNITDQYFWALAFSLDIQLNVHEDFLESDNPWAKLNLVADNQGRPRGIMSCETNISEIVRLAHSTFTGPFPCPYLHILAFFL